MGYYVRITESNVVIPGQVLSEVYRIWCEMNDSKYDSQKRGGGWSGGKQTSVWYSWMGENYDKTCETAEQILQMLGFEYEILNENGDIFISGYDSKSGQEDLFFQKIAHLLQGYINWRGEDEEEYSWIFEGGQGMLTSNPSVDADEAAVKKAKKFLTFIAES